MEQTNTFEGLKSLISELTDELSNYYIRDIYISAFIEMQKIDWAHPEKMALHSPFRQVSYIASLAMSIKQSDEVKPLDEQQWEKICEQTNQIYNYYVDVNFPENEEFLEVFNETHFKEGISIPSFLPSFSTGTTLSSEQIIEDVFECYSPYGEQIKSELGLSIEEIISISEFICETLSKRFFNGWAPLLEAWKEFRRQSAKSTNPKDILEKFRKNSSQEVYDNIQNSGIVTRNEIENNFGKEKVDTFLQVFCQNRELGIDRQIIFPTDQLSIGLKPLADVGNNQISLITGNHLLLAVKSCLYSTISKLELAERFHKRRGEVLERKVFSCLRNIFGDDAQYYSSVCETAKDHNEHDLIISIGRSLLIIECKSKSIDKTFRNVEKGFKRIEQGFKKSIQEGYNQCRNLERLLLSQDQTPLYYLGGQLACTFKKNDYDHVEKLVFTYENEGFIATKLSLLLKLDENDTYPLCMNINDLLQISTFKNYIGLTGEMFLKYIFQRKLVHSKVANDDELDILGFFFKEG